MIKQSNFFLAIALLLLLGGSASAQLRFNYNSTGSNAADLGLQAATDLWAAEFRDDITINLSFSFENIGEPLSTASSVGETFSYSEFWNAVNNDITSADDSAFFNGLNPGTSFSIYTNRTAEAGGSDHELPYLDNNGGPNNSNVFLTAANAKALGLRDGNSGGTDAAIVFNSSYAWDFDRSDGISAGALDFIGVALHEIGHAMGFESGVDVLDGIADNGASGLGTGNDRPSDDELVFVTSLDFMRFSADSEAAGADLDWTADARDKFFSVDGGLNAAFEGGSHFSTGTVYGDGQQASHWKESGGLGIMGPTAGGGELGNISEFDLRAFDGIGYDRSLSAVPEPTGLIVGLAAIPLMLRRRRR